MVTRVADSGARPSPTLTSGSAEALVTAGQQLPAPERVHFTLGRSRCPPGWTCTCCSMSAPSRPGPACRPDPVPPGGARAGLATGASWWWLIWFFMPVLKTNRRATTDDHRGSLRVYGASAFHHSAQAQRGTRFFKNL